MFFFRKPSKVMPAAGRLHKISQVETRELASDAGAKHGIFINAEMLAATGMEALAADILETFKRERAASGKTATVMLVTLIGPCEPSEFLSAWRAALARDRVAAHWLSQMEKAELGHSVSARRLGSYHSLLP